MEKEREDKKISKKEVCGDEKITSDCEGQQTTKEQIKEQNKILRNVFVGIGVFILIILLIVLFINSIRHFEYKEMKFNVIKEGEIIFYNTAFPIYHSITGKHVADYNFYIRNDPRKLDAIPFDGDLVLLHDMVINVTEDFNCDGDGIIGVANMVNLFKTLSIEVIKDEGANCDSLGRYMFLQIQPGNYSSIEKVGPACYNLNINDCEILKVTERFMTETLIKVNG